MTARTVAPRATQPARGVTDSRAMAAVYSSRFYGSCVRSVACMLSIVGGCRIEPEWGAGSGVGGLAGTGVEVDDPSAPAARAGGAGMTAVAGKGAAASAGAEARSDAGEAGIGGAGPRAPELGEGGATASGAVCAAQRASLGEIARGEARDGVRIELVAVATSQKFLLSHAQSGSCLWGVFAGSEPEGGEPRGVLVVSFGAEAPGDSVCQSGTDGIPDVTAPGEAVRIVGRFSEFSPQSCEGGVAEPQVLVDPACPVVREGSAPAVEPVALSLALADRIAEGADRSLVRRYAGGLVRLDGLTGLRADDGAGVVGPYGVVRFAETELEAHNDIAYGDLGAGGPGSPEKSLVFPHPTEFARMIGLIHLDYCTWSLALRDPCGDIAPPSENCRN